MEFTVESEWEEFKVPHNPSMDDYVLALRYINNNRVKISSDFCRYNAKFIAEAASRHHIHVYTPYNDNIKRTKYWDLTTAGRYIAFGDN